MDELVRSALAAAWPLFGLTIEAGPVVLRVVTDEDVLLQARILEGPVAPVGYEHYSPHLGVERAATAEGRARELLRYHWGKRSALTADGWSVQFSVVVDGTVVGLQKMSATDFAASRTVATGSYLSAALQGRGLGTHMRAMVIECAFAHLGARSVTSAYAIGNAPSRRVSEKLGYERVGVDTISVGGRKVSVDRVELLAHRWQEYRPRWLDAAVVRGLAPCLPLLGAAPRGVARPSQPGALAR